MSFEEAVCWAFDIVPSQTRVFFWSVSLKDLRFKVRMKLGIEHTRAVQVFATMIKVASMALGGGEESKAAPPPNIAAAKLGLAAICG